MYICTYVYITQGIRDQAGVIVPYFLLTNSGCTSFCSPQHGVQIARHLHRYTRTHACTDTECMEIYIHAFEYVFAYSNSQSIPYSPNIQALQTGQFKATSPDLTLNGGLHRAEYQHGLNLGIETILSYPSSFHFIP